MSENSNVAPGGPGIKSSEFLAFLVAVGVVLADASIYFKVEQEYIYGIFAIASAFGAGRTFLKSRAKVSGWSPVPGVIRGQVSAADLSADELHEVFRHRAAGGVSYRHGPPPPPPDRVMGEGEIPATPKPDDRRVS